jgi:hypothetical protein
MKFTLEIEMGNEAMQSYADIAYSVQRIFADFRLRQGDVEDGETGRIYDANGNRVGTWNIEE